MKKFMMPFLSVGLMLLGAMLFSGSAHAYEYTRQEKKAYGYGVWNCYVNAYTGFDNIESTVPNSVKSNAGYLWGGNVIKSNNPQFNPYLIGQAGDNLYCYQLLGGSESFNGIFINKYGHDYDNLNTLEKTDVALRALGYSPDASSGSCFTIEINVKDWDDISSPEKSYETGKICGPSSGMTSGNMRYYSENTYDSGVISLEMTNGKKVSLSIETSEYRYDYQYKIKDYNSIDSLRVAVENDLKKTFGSNDVLYYGTKAFSVTKMINESYASSYILGGRLNAALSVSNGLLGSSFKSFTDLKFSDAEKYDLYYNDYLLGYYKAEMRCDIDPNSITAKSLQDYGAVAKRMYVDGEEKECYVISSNDRWGNNVNGLSDEGYFDGTSRSFKEIVDAVDLNNLPNFDPSEYEEIIDEKEEINNANGCYDAGLDSQAWVLCPTLTNMTSAVDGLDKMVDDLLSFNTDYINDGKAEFTWNIFRNIANTIMIIVLLAIIFSQLTGYGIDNYGIKKMLPKLVIMAILINLSFILCKLAIDLSNILGVGLENLFRNFGDATFSGYQAGQHLANIVVAVFGTAAAAGATISVAVPLIESGAGGPMIVISLLLVLLTALISVLLFFISLGARLVIILVFTVVSPVAFACYILPNTQKIFKKWWDIFKAALVIYPICGALYGISFMIRSLTNIPLANGSSVSKVEMADFPMLLVSAVAPFIPFLILPALLKGTLSTLGAVGGALSSLGNGLRQGISRGNQTLQGSNAYKSAQEKQQRNMTRWQAGLKRDGTERNVGKIGKFLRGGTSGMAGARAQYLKNQNAQAKENSYMGDGFAAATIAQQKAVEADETKDYMTLVNHNTRNGEDKGALYDMYRQYEATGNKSGMVAVARIAGRRKDTAADFAKMLNNTGNTMNASVAKEIATGENSGMYRASAPFAFEYAAQVNKGFSGNYDAWSSTPGNMVKALDNYVTDSKELLGMKSGSLKELIKTMKDDETRVKAGGKALIDDNTKARIATLAAEAIENRDKNGFDYTKANEIAQLSGKYKYEYKNGQTVFTSNNGAKNSNSGPTEMDVPHNNQPTNPPGTMGPDEPVDDSGQII